MERFLLDGYKPQQLSTYALTLFRYPTRVENESIIVGKLVFCMLENLAVPQLEAENFIKMECHIIIISVVMGRRLIHLALEIPIFDIPPFFVWIYETLGMGGLGEQTPCVTSQVWITASIETIMVEMVSSVCVCAEISYCLYMPCDEMSAHENLLNQMF